MMTQPSAGGVHPPKSDESNNHHIFSVLEVIESLGKSECKFEMSTSLSLELEHLNT